MMRIDLPRVSRLATAAILMCAFVSDARAQQIHPLSGGATNPVVIAVLADGYTSTDKNDFDAEAANFFLSGLLQDTDFFQGKAGAMRIVKKFEPVASRGTSSYGFQMGVSDGACELTFPTDTIPIWTAAASVGAEYVVVIGNYPYTVGCTLGKIAYVSAGASGVKILEHEFGHMLASLWDQFALPANGTTAFPYPIPSGDTRNCARQPPPQPHWGPTAIPGCGLYNAGVVRPTDMCRMGAGHHPGFCDVCKRYFNKWFNDLPPSTGPSPIASHERAPQMGFVRASFQPPSQPSGAQQPIVRLLLRFNATTGTAEPRRGFNSTGIYVPSHRRVGKYAYEIVDGPEGKQQLIDFGVLSDQLFQTRGYAGGVGEHGVAPTASTEVIVQIPGETIERLRSASSNVSMVIWELLPDFPGDVVNRGMFVTHSEKFMRKTHTITAAEIKKVLPEK